MPQALDILKISSDRGQKRSAATVVAVVLLVAAAVVPFGRLVLPIAAGFAPSLVGALIVVHIVTASLLLRHVFISGRLSLTILAATYAFSSVVLLAMMLVSPGYIDRPIGGLHPYAATYLWMLWHIAGPLGIAVSLAAAARTIDPVRARLLVILYAPLGGLIVSTAIVARSGAFPPLIVAGAFQPIFTDIVVPAAFVPILVATVLLLRQRLHLMIDLWLGVVLVAAAIELCVFTSGGSRFTLGWYAAKMDTLVASAALLCVLLTQSSRLHLTAAVAERRLRALIDGVADALIAIDDEQRISSFNPAAHELFGYTREDVARLTITDIIPNFLDRVRASESVNVVEAQGRNADGRTFPIEIALSEGGDREWRGAIVIVRDITQRKRTESVIKTARDQAIQSAKIKAQFLATMSHELRTPINAVVGTSELLLQSKLSAEAYDYAKTVRDSAESLLGVISDILDFSKIEAGKMEIDVRPFSALGIVENAADICAPTARGKHLSLSTHVAPDVPANLLGDANRLRQVLINLIGNAVKFTAAGNVVVRAVVDTLDGDRTVMRFSITDTGPGIAADQIGTLFEPFRQADGSARRRFGGTGLGLSISKQLVELMGGEIRVTSTLGQGSTFWFQVPFERLDDENPEPAKTLRGVRVLVVDDDDTSRMIVDQYLMQWGIVGTSTSNPSHAVALLKAASLRGAPYAAAMVDFVMPGVDGFALSARIRSEAAIAATPLVLFTAHDKAGLGAEAIARGFAAFLRKPLKQSALFDALSTAISGRKAPGGIALDTAVPLQRDGVLVLVAEDNPVNRKLALHQLRKLGYRAHAVTDGAEAVEAVLHAAYDVILMDCQMPGMDGFEATRAIRRAETVTGAHIPIVAITANALEGDRETCLAAGMDEYLAKPVQLAQLRAILEQFTSGAVGAR